MRYIKFNITHKVAVAVSGGYDSLHLAIYTQYIYPEIEIVGLIVNHNLRQEAYEECLFAQEELSKHGIISHILTWHHPHNTQYHARKARYTLLTAKCYELGIKVLLTGHHMNDMIETYVMRFEHGSGTRGLSSIHARNFCNGIEILRPLILNLKSEIKQCINKWVNDPSNANEKFTRVQIRNRDNLNIQNIIEQIKIHSAKRYLDDQALQYLLPHIHINNNSSIEIEYSILESLTQSLLNILISKLIYFISNYYVDIGHFNIHCPTSKGLVNIYKHGTRLLLIKQNKSWHISTTYNNWLVSPCYRFFIYGNNICYNHKIGNLVPLGGKYIQIISKSDVLNSWLDPFTAHYIEF